MRIVAALGGNALLRRGEPLDLDTQRRNARVAARALAGLARGHELVVTHGNGPQVGLLALQSSDGAAPTPLDVLDAQSEGMIGYVLEQELGCALGAGSVATLLTQTIVDADDPAFGAPAKPIGPMHDRATAQRRARERGWAVAPDGAGWRRVVASPEPRAIVELRAVEALIDAGLVAICAGGGGIPVIARGGRLEGVEAVVDKDLTSEVLARALGADLLLLLTDVAGVERGHGGPDARVIAAATAGELEALDLPAGSMGPKARAAARFVAATGRRAAIGRLDAAAALAAGTAGTQVRADAAVADVVARRAG